MKCALALILALTLVAPLLGCGKPSKELKAVGNKAGETWDAAKTYAVKKKDEAIVLFSKEMEGMDGRLAEAKEQAAKLGGEAAKALDGKWQVVSEKFDQMKDASGEKWDQTRDAFTAAYEAFVKELEESGESAPAK